MSKKLGLESKYKQFINPTKLGEYKAVMGKGTFPNPTIGKGMKVFPTVMKKLPKAASSVLKRTPVGRIITAIGKAVTSKPGYFGAGAASTALGNKIQSNVKKENKKMGGGMMMKYKTGKDVKLSPKQKKIAAMAGNPNKIDAPDFAKLRMMKANKGVFANIMKPGKMEGEKAYLKRLKETGTSAEKKAYGYLKAKGKTEDRLTRRDVQAALKAIGVNVKKPSPEIKATGARMGKMMKKKNV